MSKEATSEATSEVIEWLMILDKAYAAEPYNSDTPGTLNKFTGVSEDAMIDDTTLYDIDEIKSKGKKAGILSKLTERKLKGKINKESLFFTVCSFPHLINKKCKYFLAVKHLEKRSFF